MFVFSREERLLQLRGTAATTWKSIYLQGRNYCTSSSVTKYKGKKYKKGSDLTKQNIRHDSHTRGKSGD